MKHTPGPWIVTEDGFIRQLEQNEGHRLYVASAVEIPFEFGGDKTTTANLNLFAAAPELYNALKSLVDLYDGDESGLWKFEEEFNNARASIKKADGK